MDELDDVGLVRHRRPRRPLRVSDGDVGYGLHEHGFFGPFPKYGLERGDDTFQ